MTSESGSRADVSIDAARTLLVDLVSTPSLSGDEAAATERLVDFFEEYDREVWIDDIGNVRAPADDTVLFTSHIDTVPGDIPVRVDDAEPPRLWGRGSVDATGSLAAMAVAAVRTGSDFVGVVREETDSAGARHLVTDRCEPGALVNGEPSGTDGITLGYRGLVSGTYLATSESGHSSRPTANALQQAIRWWSTVEGTFEHDDYESIFDQVTAKPIACHGGTSDDGLSVEATMDVQFRIPPSTDAESVRELAESELEVGTISWNDPIPPVMESSRTSLARAFRKAIRRHDMEPRLLRKTGTSDMNIYAASWECPMVTYGPGDSSLDHTPDEHLSLDEFDRAISIYEAVADDLGGAHS